LHGGGLLGRQGDLVVVPEEDDAVLHVAPHQHLAASHRFGQALLAGLREGLPGPQQGKHLIQLRLHPGKARALLFAELERDLQQHRAGEILQSAYGGLTVRPADGAAPRGNRGGENSEGRSLAVMRDKHAPPLSHTLARG
jgi:hypothetical protein